MHQGAYRLYITHVFEDFECDVHFPDFDKNVFKEIRSVDYHLHALDISFPPPNQVNFEIAFISQNHVIFFCWGGGHVLLYTKLE